MVQRAAKVWQFILGVTEGIALRVFFQRIVGFRNHCFNLLEGSGTFESKLTSRAVEGRDRDRVIEGVVEPAKAGGSWRNIQSRLKEPEIVTIPGPAHDPVLAQLH